MAIAPLTHSLEWTLLFNVVFGSIASRAFSEFYQSIFGDLDADQDVVSTTTPSTAPAQTVARYYGLRILVFVSAFAFYIYDWIVLQVLFERYPYSISNGLSYFRFANDLVMVFLLFSIVSTAARPRVLDRPMRLIVFVSAWHILAGAWHILALCEFGKSIDFDQALRWHFLYVQCLYWVPYLVNLYIILPRQQMKSTDVVATTRASQHWILVVECCTLFVVSTVRVFVVLSSN